MKIRIAVVQPETLTGADAPRNVDRAVEYVREAAREGAQLVAFPETYPGPYTVPLTYSPHDALAAVAREERVWVVAGALESVHPGEGRDGACFNGLSLYGPDGRRAGTYRRTSPPGPWIYQGGRFWDFKYQEANDLPVFETDFGTLGILMCSEVYVPELARIMALKGAVITLMPAGLWNWQLHDTWRTLLWARAIENLMVTATSRNVLPGGGGHAIICGPEEVLAETTRTGVLTATVDLARIQWLRETHDHLVSPFPWRTKPGIFTQWRRPELYGDLDRA